jgi:hypothetical protein
MTIGGFLKTKTGFRKSRAQNKGAREGYVSDRAEPTRGAEALARKSRAQNKGAREGYVSDRAEPTRGAEALARKSPPEV